MALPEYPSIAAFRGDIVAWVTNGFTLVNNMLQGRQNVVGSITLTADGESTSTRVIDNRAHKYSVILFDPLDDVAASMLAAGTVFVPGGARIEGEFTIVHPSVGEGELVEFYYLIIG